MLTRIALFASLFAAGVYGQIIIGSGPNGPASFTRNYSFPPAGLGSGETAQVNVVNVAPAPTAANAAAPSCTGTITFTNAAGATVASAPFATDGSQIFTTQLAFGKLASTGNRAEFIATVQLNTPVPAKAPCSPAFSLETFDNSTFATHLYLGNASAGAVTPLQIALVP